MKPQKYTKQFEIYYYQIDRSQKASPIAILNMLEETAISHSDYAGLGVQNLLDQGLCWVLNRWSLQMDSYPSLKETITVETWPSHVEKFYATRQFQIKDSNGCAIGKVVSLWILLNFERRRPARIPEEFGDRYGMNSEEVFVNPFSVLDTNFEPEYSTSLKVRRSDIDTNNHVNNSKYVEWALEEVPQEIYDNCTLRSLEVEYKKEVNYGAFINSECRANYENHEKLEFSHRILGADKTTDHAIARSVWVR